MITESKTVSTIQDEFWEPIRRLSEADKDKLRQLLVNMAKEDNGTLTAPTRLKS